MRKAVKLIVAVLLLPIICVVLLKTFEVYEYKRISKMCFGIETGKTLEAALEHVEEFTLVKVESWKDARAQKLGLPNSYAVATSQLSFGTMSCYIEHEENIVKDVSTGSHFWSFLYDYGVL